jgi:hypothetical protein
MNQPMPAADTQCFEAFRVKTTLFMPLASPVTTRLEVFRRRDAGLPAEAAVLTAKVERELSPQEIRILSDCLLIALQKIEPDCARFLS